MSAETIGWLLVGAGALSFCGGILACGAKAARDQRRSDAWGRERLDNERWS